jgi:tryptophanyl-tRNA synthetase
MNKRVFSGIQPTGIIHFGNYFGAINNWLPLQKEFECLFCIVDLHAMTVHQSPEEFAVNIKNLCKIYLASGLDPKTSMIFRQSAVLEHTQLAWILNCLTPMGELERMTQYKDKSAQHKDNINAGLLTYPVLMAADILLYDTMVVPVGEDQVQHVELARTIARKFNNMYGEVFVEPKTMLNKEAARLRGLDDPEKKMSQSASSELNYIAMTDTPDMVVKKIKKAVTDSGTEISYNPETRPAISNLMTISRLVTGKSFEEIEAEFNGKGYGVFKNALADQINAFLKPIQEKFKAIDDNELNKILEVGAKSAKKIAEKKMDQVRRAVGL